MCNMRCLYGAQVHSAYFICIRHVQWSKPYQTASHHICVADVAFSEIAASEESASHHFPQPSSTRNTIAGYFFEWASSEVYFTTCELCSCQGGVSIAVFGACFWQSTIKLLYEPRSSGRIFGANSSAANHATVSPIEKCEVLHIATAWASSRGALSFHKSMSYVVTFGAKILLTLDCPEWA